MEQNTAHATYNFDISDKFFLEDIEKRHLFLNEAIDESVISNIVYYILRYNLEDKDIPIESRKPIILYINSVGGDIIPGFGVIDTLLTSQTPVYTVNIGECSSTGFLIFISGSKRFAMPHSEFLLHDGHTGGIDSMAKMRDRIEFEAGELSNEIKTWC